jgi:hypothetical protein
MAIQIHPLGARPESQFCIQIFEVGNENSITHQSCGEGPSGSVLFSLPPNRIFVLAIDASGYRRYVSSPFSLSEGQVMPLTVRLVSVLSLETISPDLQLALTVVSLFLVLCGLFKEQLDRMFLHYPLLRVVVSGAPPFCHDVTADVSRIQGRSNEGNQGLSDRKNSAPAAETGSGGRPRTVNFHFCRVWIENVGTAEAEDVTVIVRRIWRTQEFLSGPPAQRFLPQNLRWANTWDYSENPKKLRDHREVTLRRISRDAGQYCDLGFIVQENFRKEYFEKIDVPGAGYQFEENPKPRLDFAFDPLSLSEYSEFSGGCIELVVDAKNTSPQSVFIKFGVLEPAHGDRRVWIQCADEDFAKKNAIPSGEDFPFQRPIQNFGRRILRPSYRDDAKVRCKEEMEQQPRSNRGTGA